MGLDWIGMGLESVIGGMPEGVVDRRDWEVLVEVGGKLVGRWVRWWAGGVLGGGMGMDWIWGMGNGCSRSGCYHDIPRCGARSAGLGGKDKAKAKATGAQRWEKSYR